MHPMKITGFSSSLVSLLVIIKQKDRAFDCKDDKDTFAGLSQK